MLEEGGFGDYVTPQYGPAAVHWCSTPLLEAVARASADTGRHVHMHCLETPYQRAWADKHYPQGMLRFLDDIGLLSPRLTLAHCAHARPDELPLLAERGVTIATISSSNLYLNSGIAPVPEMLRQGCRIAMGLDGTGFDEDDDALREMRVAYMLHRGWGFEMTMTRAQLWDFAGRHGARSVSGRGRGVGLGLALVSAVAFGGSGVAAKPLIEAGLDPLHVVWLRVAGAALVMSPALVGKYLDAAKEVAAHAVLLPDGLTFSPATGRMGLSRRSKMIRRASGRIWRTAGPFSRGGIACTGRSRSTAGAAG